MRVALGLLGSIAIAVTPAGTALPTVRVGTIQSDRNCSLYQQTAGRHREAGAIGPYGVAYASETSWITYLVRDCADNFASLRTSLQAALAASGKLAVAPGGGGGYVVSGRISSVSGGGAAEPAVPSYDGGFAVSSSRMLVNMDVTLRDPVGRIVYGGLLTKTLETGFSMATPGMSSGSVRSGQAVYTELQHQVAFAVARLVAFRIEPLRVTGGGGPRIHVNYGAPLLPLGTTVQVAATSGSIARYHVTVRTGRRGGRVSRWCRCRRRDDREHRDGRGGRWIRPPTPAGSNGSTCLDDIATGSPRTAGAPTLCQRIVAPIHQRIAPVAMLLILRRALLGMARDVGDHLLHVRIVGVRQVRLLRTLDRTILRPDWWPTDSAPSLDFWPTRLLSSVSRKVSIAAGVMFTAALKSL